MFLTLEQRLKGVRVALAIQVVLAVALWVILVFALYVGTGEFAVSFREAMVEQGADPANFTPVLVSYSIPTVIAVVVAGIGLLALRKRTRVLSLAAVVLLMLELAAGLANGGFPVIVAVALFLLARRDVMEHLNAWPKKSA